MRIFENALAIELMLYINNAGDVQRKSLYVPFAGYSYKYYARVVKRLIDEGYIEVFKKYKVNYIKLTRKGKSVLIEKDVIPEQQKPKKEKQYTASAKRRERLVADAMRLCDGSGILYGEDVPPLSGLFGKEKGLQSEGYEKQFEECLQDGIFYSAGDVRHAYAEIFGKSEIANWTRLIGVIFMNNKLTFLYSVGTKLIQWRDMSEERTVELIQDLLIKSDCINRNIRIKVNPSCVVCGRGMSLVPKIVTGRRWGKKETDETKERFRAVIARDHINSHNIAKVFSSAYYVPVSKAGISSFKLACVLQDDKREENCDKWFSSVAGVTRIRNLPFHQGVAGNGSRVVYMPYIDLVELEYYKRQNDACHFVIPEGTQEAVSRVMGPLLLSAQSLKGTQLKYRKYDASGAPLDGSVPGYMKGV